MKRILTAVMVVVMGNIVYAGEFLAGRAFSLADIGTDVVDPPVPAAERVRGASAWQVSTGDFDQWVTSLKAAPSVYEQLDAYFRENASGADAPQAQYVSSLPELLKERSFKEMSDTLASNGSGGSCQAFFKAGFVSKLFPGGPATAAGFEKEMVRVESVSCLGAKDLDNVFEVLMSDDFQKRTIMGLRQVVSDTRNNRVCHDIRVPLMGKSAYCFTQNVWKNPDSFVIHSYNETNENNPSVFVYYREMLTVVKRLVGGEILVYNLAYGRGPSLPFHSLTLNLMRGQYDTYGKELADGTGR